MRKIKITATDENGEILDSTWVTIPESDRVVNIQPLPSENSLPYWNNSYQEWLQLGLE